MINSTEGVDIDAMAEALFDIVAVAVTDDAVHSVLVAQSEKIRIIAKACEGTEMFSKSAAKFEAFKASIEENTEPDKRLVSCWMWLMNLIIEAPTGFHMRVSVRLCMPLVAMYLPDDSAVAAAQ